MTRKSPITVVVTALLALAYAGLLFVVMGVGHNNTAVFGVPLGYQEAPKPDGDWSHALSVACRENNLNASMIESARLLFTMAPRRCYYRARLTGARGNQQIKVHVTLTAPDGGKWVLTEWREE